MKFAKMLREHKFLEAEEFASKRKEREILLFLVHEAKYGRNETDLGRGAITSFPEKFLKETGLIVSLPSGRGTVISW